MRYFTRALRTEMKPYDVKVTCLLPGATATSLYDPKVLNINLAKKFHIMHTPEMVARKGVSALFSNKAECIPGLVNKFAVRLLPYLPSYIIDLINRKSNLLAK